MQKIYIYVYIEKMGEKTARWIQTIANGMEFPNLCSSTPTVRDF